MLRQMSSIHVRISALVAVLALAAIVARTYAQTPAATQSRPASEPVMVMAGELKWGPAPPALPAGAEAAVIAGDPAKEGSPYVMRVKFPDGYKVAPHWHPKDENVTVLEGTFLVGKGEKRDESAMHALPAGSFMRMPATTRHFAGTKGATTIQVHGVGPGVVSAFRRTASVEAIGAPSPPP